MRHGSLFSGIGGFSLAAKWMGWRNVFDVEINKFCQSVLAKQFPETDKYYDITTFDARAYDGAIDIVTGGFPCQPFSRLGKRRQKDDPRYLFPEMLRVISECKPRYVVAENVAQSVRDIGEEVCASLEDQGYEVWTFILPATSVSANHHRQRAWYVGYSARSGCDSRVRCEDQVQSDSAGCRLAMSLLQSEAPCPTELCGLAYGLSNGLYYDIEPIRGIDLDNDRLIKDALDDGHLVTNSETGEVFSSKINGKKGQLVELTGSDSQGYRQHCICFQSKKAAVKAHRIVWISANGLIPENLEIDHINRNRADNRLSNLRLVNKSENTLNRDERGENNPAAKLTESEVRYILEGLKAGVTHQTLADVFNVSKGTITHISTGRTWKHLSDDPVPDRQHRCSALGNAIVPQIALQIFQSIQKFNDTLS